MNDQQLAAEQAEFEKWYAEEYGASEIAFAKDPSGNYIEDEVDNSWAAWQAALAQREPVCATCNGHGRIGGPSYREPDEGGILCPDCNTPDLCDEYGNACTVQREPLKAASAEDQAIYQQMSNNYAQREPHQCNFPLCQSAEYQKDLAEQIHRELYGRREPVVEGEVAEAVTYMRMYDAKDRYSAAQPFDVQKIHDAADLLERTEAARLNDARREGWHAAHGKSAILCEGLECTRYEPGEECRRAWNEATIDCADAILAMQPPAEWASFEQCGGAPNTEWKHPDGFGGGLMGNE